MLISTRFLCNYDRIKAMKIKVEKLRREDLDEFWQVFSQIIQRGFPGYSQIVINHFLNKTYTKSNFDYWLSTGWKIVLVAKNPTSQRGASVKENAKGAKKAIRPETALSEIKVFYTIHFFHRLQQP